MLIVIVLFDKNSLSSVRQSKLSTSYFPGDRPCSLPPVSDHSAVDRVGVDETAARRGHDYVSLFVDMDERKVLFATPGKDPATIEAFAQDLKVHGGKVESIKEVSMDIS